MIGATLDTGALIALESGSTRMAVLVEEALAGRAELAVPAGVLAQAWRGGARQARIARLLRASSTSVVPLDTKMAVRVGARCAITRTAGIVDVSVAICARDRRHPVITSDPDDIAAIDPALKLVRPT
jgi:predicted nucleic acid-binding protein